MWLALKLMKIQKAKLSYLDKFFITPEIF